jgi:hypothetical protein
MHTTVYTNKRKLNVILAKKNFFTVIKSVVIKWEAYPKYRLRKRRQTALSSNPDFATS